MNPADFRSLKILSSIKNSSPVLPSEFKILRVYFRALKVVFKSSMLPPFRPSILPHNSREKVTMNREKLAKFPTCVSLTFLKSYSPQYCLASMKSNSLWNLSE